MTREETITELVSHINHLSTNNLEILLQGARNLKLKEKETERMERRLQEMRQVERVGKTKKVILSDGSISQVEITIIKQTDNPMASVWNKLLND